MEPLILETFFIDCTPQRLCIVQNFAGVFGNNQQGPDRQGGGGVVLVYGWSIVLFASLLWIGNQMIKGNSRTPDESISTTPTMRGHILRLALLGYANMAFVCLILVSSNVEVDARAIEELGWYGQLSVLMVLTCLLAFVYCLVFWFVFRNMGRDNGSTLTTDRETELTTGYHLDTSTDAAAAPTITESNREVDSGNPDQIMTESHKHKQGGWFDMPSWLS
jgi:hypothetical protein